MRYVVLGILVVVVSFAVIPRAVSQTQGETAEQKVELFHRAWFNERYREASSIKPGMTRDQLERTFHRAGGLSTEDKSRYCLNRLDMLEIEVQFDIAKPDPNKHLQRNPGLGNPNDIIRRVGPIVVHYPTVD